MNSDDRSQDYDDQSQDLQKAPNPLISFILPIYNAKQYLSECLNAITQQSFGKIEIIAVDGASNDGSGKILDERARTEPRLTVFHCDKKIGPGNARNIGARSATGEYIWFVDGDDMVVADCLTTIAQALRSATPDVLLIDYAIVRDRAKSAA